MQNSLPLPRGEQGTRLGSCYPLRWRGGIRDGVGDPALPNSAWGAGTLAHCAACTPLSRCLHPAALLPAPLCPAACTPLSCCLPPCAPGAPGLPREQGIPHGGSQHPTALLLRAASEPLSPPNSPPPSQPPAAGARLQEQGDIVRGCRAQVLGSPRPPVLLPAGVLSPGASGLFADVAILCIALPGFPLPFRPSGAFEVRL